MNALGPGVRLERVTLAAKTMHMWTVGRVIGWAASMLGTRVVMADVISRPVERRMHFSDIAAHSDIGKRAVTFVDDSLLELAREAAHVIPTPKHNILRSGEGDMPSLIHQIAPQSLRRLESVLDQLGQFLPLRLQLLLNLEGGQPFVHNGFNAFLLASTTNVEGLEYHSDRQRLVEHVAVDLNIARVVEELAHIVCTQRVL